MQFSLYRRESDVDASFVLTLSSIRDPDHCPSSVLIRLLQAIGPIEWLTWMSGKTESRTYRAPRLGWVFRSVPSIIPIWMGHRTETRTSARSDRIVREIVLVMPDELHASLAQRALATGLAVEHYLIRVLSGIAERWAAQEPQRPLIQASYIGALVPVVPLESAHEEPRLALERAPASHARERELVEATIAFLVRAMREYRGLTQTDLATELGAGWSRNAVASLEARRRMLQFAEYPLLCRALRIEPDKLLRLIPQWRLLAGEPHLLTAENRSEETGISDGSRPGRASWPQDR